MMERFAKIKPSGKRRKLDVSTICRCCGMESTDKVEILGQYTDDGVEFSEKLQALTAVTVKYGDRMPQSMCDMCIDKINDFYEFRLMAQNTEIQTRQGLPQFKPYAAAEPTYESKVKFVSKYSAEDTALIDKALECYKQTTNSIPSTSKKRNEKFAATATPPPPAKKSRKEVSCSICKDVHFGYLTDLNDHMKDHVPRVAKYACGSCQETFEQLSDNKAHESMHTKEKLPYTCFICLAAYARARDFNKHMMNYNCAQKEKLLVTVEDIKCFQCKKKFLTQNLFEWHGCFLKTKGNCSKCGQFFQKKKLLFKHYVLCEGKFVAPELELMQKVKAEGSNAQPLRVSTENTTKGPKKKIVPNRKVPTQPDNIKKEPDLDPPDEEDEYANYEEDITYDNFGNDSDSNDEPFHGFEPEVKLQEKPAVKIKQERLSDPSAIEHKTNQNSSELIRNIKKEKGVVPATVVTTSNDWKLKIKAEKGTSQSANQVLNPLALGSNKPCPAQKKIFKLPQGLAMKIKMEKKDAGYGDVIGERDEAEPDEDEDLLGDQASVVRIKEEKMDPGYGDSQSLSKPKQLINPMALMREKSSSNGLPEKSLVISAVTSINPDSPGEASVDGEAMTQNDIPTNAHETPETNDVPAVVVEKPCENLMMVQIPREFAENLENHSSPSDKCDESSLLAGASESNCHEGEATVAPAESGGDDLDSLLKKYEESAPADNNDLFNDLLKFD